ncbi:MAG: D-aminoacyl-tRNA deacylase [Oscillospiraceae bacterium]
MSLLISISEGLLVFVGLFERDTEETLRKFCQKVENLRIFEDANSRLNLSAKDVNAEILLISNFTLCAAPHSGNRPYFGAAAEKTRAKLFFESMPQLFTVKTKLGVFGAYMKIQFEVDGPVNLILEV